MIIRDNHETPMKDSPGPTLRITVTESSPLHLYSCTLHHFSSSRSLLRCGRLDCGQPLATPLSPILPCGWVDGTGGILGCIHVCTEKEVGLEGGGFVIVTGANSRWQIPGMLVRQDQ